tara:strand:+ start:248 stop:970 length:723 start_codon:yes stop_codon:yes gene_type:complete
MNDTCKIAEIEINLYKSAKDAASQILNSFIINRKFLSAVAMNPEKVVSLYDSPELKRIISNFNIKYVDGSGLAFLIGQKIYKKVPRIAGCDLWEELMVESGKRKLKVFLIGADLDTLRKTEKKLRDIYKVDIVDTMDGFSHSEDEFIDRLKKVKPDIVSVALGSPKQEKFINLCKINQIDSVFMGVGGTYDVFIGKKVRASKEMQSYGLEWFHRLLHEPLRIRRNIRLLKFIYLAILKKI